MKEGKLLKAVNELAHKKGIPRVVPLPVSDEELAKRRDRQKLDLFRKTGVWPQ